MNNPATTPADILAEASNLVSTDRNQQYGDYSVEAIKLAHGWSAILRHTIEPRMVPLMMVWLKVVRESYSHKHDNCVDMAGYSALAGTLGASATVRTAESVKP